MIARIAQAAEWLVGSIIDLAALTLVLTVAAWSIAQVVCWVDQ